MVQAVPTDGERLARAHRAEHELQLTGEIFNDLRSALIERWTATGSDQVATREKLHQAVQTLEAVRKALVAAVADGAVVRHARETADLLRPADQDRR